MNFIPERSQFREVSPGSWTPKSQKGDVVLWLHPAPLSVVAQQTGVLLAGPELFLSWRVVTWWIFPLGLLLISGWGEKVLHRHLSPHPAGPEQGSCDGFRTGFDVRTDVAVVWCWRVSSGQAAVTMDEWILSGWAGCGWSTVRTKVWCGSMEVGLSFSDLVNIVCFSAGGFSLTWTLSVEVEEKLLSMPLRSDSKFNTQSF